MATKILTWQDLFDWLELNEDSPDEDEIERLAEAVESHVEKMLRGNRFDEVTVTDLAVDGTGADFVRTPDTPITALTAVKIGRKATDPLKTLDVNDPDVVVFYADTGLIKRTDGGKFARKPKFVLLSYKAGWTKTTVPADVKTALLLLVAYLWNSRGREAIQRETIPTIVSWVGRAMEDTPGVKRFLAPYTRQLVASVF